jgi:hypothetical protein
MSLRVALLASLATAALVRQAHAQPRLDVKASTCKARAREVERRLLSVVDAQSSALAASVTFDEAGDGVRVSVATRENFAAQGETVLVVPTCDEAIDAAVVVLSLAFSAELVDEPASGGGETTRHEGPRGESQPVPEQEVELRFAAPSPRRDESPAGVPPRVISAGSAHLTLAGGVDAGTLPTPAVFVALGLAHSWSRVEVRSSLRYGLLTQDERVETGFSESVQRDFGSVGISVCYGVGANFRLSGCTGGEFGVLRLGRKIEVDGAAPRRHQDELSPRLSGVFGGILSARHGRLRPELELSGSVLALGRRDGTSPVALRAAAGAAVDF